MKKLFSYLSLIMLLGATSLIVSCKKDEVDTIVLKQTGSVNMTFLYGDQPLKNTKVSLYNGDSWGLVEILNTDESGTINLQNYIEGNYKFSFEINEPQYSEITQEFQVISGSTRKQSIQAKDHVGRLSVSLIDAFSSNIVKDDLKIGVAMVPNNQAYKKALTHKEILSLATEIQYFGTSGKLEFNNVPTGYYNMFKVNAAADTILSSWKSNSYISNNGNSIDTYSINLVNEVIGSKSLFSVENMNSVDYNREAITENPFTSIKFFMDGNEHKIQFTLENEVVFTGNLYLSSDGSYSVSSIQSNDDNFGIIFYANWPSKITYNEGKIRMIANQIRVIDYSTWPSISSYYYDATLTLQ